MPVYRYVGRRTYVSSKYGIRAEPGDIIHTSYYIRHPDFVLIQPNNPDPAVPYTVDYTLDDVKKVNINGFSVVSVKLLNEESASAECRFESLQSPGVTLTSSYSEFKMDFLGYRTLYLVPLSGVPVVRVLFGYTRQYCS